VKGKIMAFFILSEIIIFKKKGRNCGSKFSSSGSFHRDYSICLNMSSRTSSYRHSPQSDFQHNRKKPDDRSPA